MRRRLLLASSLAVVATLLVSPGCTPKIDASLMVADYHSSAPQPQMCSVKVLPSGPQPALLFDTSLFREALNESLNKAAMFAHVVDESNSAAQYRLVVSLREVFDRRMYSRWVLTRADRSLVWDADYTIKPSVSGFTNFVNLASKATIEKALTDMDLALRKSPRQ